MIGRNETVIGQKSDFEKYFRFDKNPDFILWIQP